MLQVTRLSKTYSQRRVLNDLTIEARSGELIGILGRSGAGKTTLLNSLSGLIQVEQGDIVFNGERLNSLGFRQRCAKRVEQYSQTDQFSSYGWRPRTVRQFLCDELRSLSTMPSLGRRMQADEAARRCDELLNDFGLQTIASIPISHLPAGQKRCLQLIRRMCHEPRLLLLDEPFSGMDIATCEAICRWLEHLRNQEVTVLLTDQYYQHVLRVSTKVMILSNGKIVVEDTAVRVVNNPAAKLHFFGDHAATHRLETRMTEDSPVAALEGPCLLRLTELSKSFGRRQVINNVAFELRKGEIVGLLGPNGAGKSTTLRSAIGLIRPNSGKIFVHELEVSRIPAWQRVRMGIGYVAQQTSVFGYFTVEENIRFCARSRRGRVESAPSSESRVSLLMSIFGLEHIRKSRCSRLSGGERKRLELACSMARLPTMLILDEPFSGIDPVTIDGIKHTLRSACGLGMSILIVDHYVRDAFQLTDKVHIMANGSIIASGNPQQVLADKEARAHYLGDILDH